MQNNFKSASSNCLDKYLKSQLEENYDLKHFLYKDLVLLKCQQAVTARVPNHKMGQTELFPLVIACRQHVEWWWAEQSKRHSVLSAPS